jgi:hypothetical protein
MNVSKRTKNENFQICLVLMTLFKDEITLSENNTQFEYWKKHIIKLFKFINFLKLNNFKIQR